MDHFDTFDPNAAPFEVECLFHKTSPLSYDFLGYHGFPKRKNWGESSGDIGFSESQEEVDEFLQSWLYVGFLSEWTDIAGIPFDLNQFIRPNTQNSDRRWITTKQLPVYCAAWVVREHNLQEQLSDVEYQQHKQSCINRLRPLLENVLVWTRTLVSRDEAQVALANDGALGTGNTTPRRLIVPEFATAVFALRFSIASTAKHMWKLPSTLKMDPGFDGRKLFLSQLLDNGWCPYDIQYLGISVTVDACYYVCSYYPARALRDHTECDKYHCKADVYDNTGGYRNRHTDDVEDCSCALQGPDIQELCQSFECEGGFPLVVIRPVPDCSEDDVFEVEMQCFDPSKPVDYIAFSHVWADGLGNPTSNALPTCQLPTLQKMANAAYASGRDDKHTDPIPFWIDTLCVPVGKHLVRYRYLAIQRMRATYQMAKKVLVLDKEILSGSVNATPGERIVRVVLSTWMRRLWTLQEGFLAQELLFQFRDGPCSMEDIVEAERARPESFWNVGGVALATMFSGIMGLSKTDPHPDRIFTSSFDGLQWRSTTLAADETLCLAVLMGIDPLPLLNVASRDAFNSGEDKEALLAKRMQVLLQLIKRLPPGIIFLSENRLLQNGFKWAPAALLGLQGPRVLSQPLQQTYVASLHRQREIPEAEPSNMAELTEGGGLMVSMLSMALGEFAHKCIEKRFKVAHLRPEQTAETYEIRLFDTEAACERVIGTDGKGIVILLNNRVIAHRDRVRCSESVGVMVSLREETESSYKKVDFICRVIVSGNQMFEVPEHSKLRRDELVLTEESDMERPIAIVKGAILQVMGNWQIF